MRRIVLPEVVPPPDPATAVVSLTVEEHMRVAALAPDTREALLGLLATLQRVKPELNRAGVYSGLLAAVERSEADDENGMETECSRWG